MTAGLVLLALQLVPPSWQSNASIVLLPPKSTVGRGGNPYLQLGGLAPTMDLLRVALTDQQMAEQLKSVSQTAEFTVKADTSSSGPVLLISATDHTGASAIAVRDALLKQAPLKLESLQDSVDIPRAARISSMLLSQDVEPQVVGKNQIRAVVVAAGLGLVGTVLLVGLVDGTLGTRRRPISLETDGDEPDSGEPDEPKHQVVVASEWDRANNRTNGARRAAGHGRRSSESKSAATGTGEADTPSWADPGARRVAAGRSRRSS